LKCHKPVIAVFIGYKPDIQRWNRGFRGGKISAQGGEEGGRHEDALKRGDRWISLTIPIPDGQDGG